MKAQLLEKLRATIAEWAQKHDIETTVIDAQFSGIGAGVHLLVVARRGFENWRWADRERDLFRFINHQFNGNGNFVITRLETMTEGEYEKFEEVAA